MPLVGASSTGSFSSSFSSYFSPRVRSPFVPLRPRARRLPNELLTELATFAHYDFLELSRAANSRLRGLFRPILQRKDAKLCELFFDDVRSLSLWFKNWAVRSDALRKFVNLRATVDSKWCEEAMQTKPDLWAVNRARVTSRGLNADLRELRILTDELIATTHKGRLMQSAAAVSAPRDWLRVFGLGPSSSVRFHSQRSLLIAKSLALPKTVVDRWLNKDLPSLKALVRGLVQLLRDDFKDESTTCQSQYTGCITVLKTCDSRLKVLIASLN
ncbi:hypothetical protein niasHT_021830 [Heterodera trifolii]|uniref:F-box domain-containing protein n=1 Tax=Heterodera trifolii TaxID=157864 RepID=A0ABD2KJI5_9BILA